MKHLRYLARIVCTVGMLLIGTYTGLAFAIAFFIVNGTLTPGDTMFHDSRTPALFETILFAFVGAAATATIAVVRGRLSMPAPTQSGKT